MGGVEPFFGFQFAAPIGRIGLRLVTLADFLVGLFLADGTHDAEAADIDETLESHL